MMGEVEQGPGAEPGWYSRKRNPYVMMWWDGEGWLDPDEDLPSDDGGMAHFLRFVIVLAVMQVCVAFLFGYFIIPFALRRTGRRARDILMLLIPVWGVVVWVQTFWRLSARRIYWSPRGPSEQAAVRSGGLAVQVEAKGGGMRSGRRGIDLKGSGPSIQSVVVVAFRRSGRPAARGRRTRRTAGDPRSA